MISHIGYSNSRIGLRLIVDGESCAVNRIFTRNRNSGSQLTGNSILVRSHPSYRTVRLEYSPAWKCLLAAAFCSYTDRTVDRDLEIELAARLSFNRHCPRRTVWGNELQGTVHVRLTQVQ